jgi:hypothetical protein
MAGLGRAPPGGPAAGGLRPAGTAPGDYSAGLEGGARQAAHEPAAAQFSFALHAAAGTAGGVAGYQIAPEGATREVFPVLLGRLGSKFGSLDW